jgi:hypothetical protein
MAMRFVNVILYVGHGLRVLSQSLRLKKCTGYRQFEVEEILLCVWASSEGPRYS